MHSFILEYFGEGSDLNTLQMCCRGVVVLLIALLMIRISGRRSFGMGTPMDNIIIILLGAVLSRAVTGASPFVPVISVCFMTVILHRIFLWLLLVSPRLRSFLEGKKILLYKNGKFIDENMTKALVSKDDISRSLRLSALSEDLEKIDEIFMERNGRISVVHKKQIKQDKN